MSLLPEEIKSSTEVSAPGSVAVEMLLAVSVESLLEVTTPNFGASPTVDCVQTTRIVDGGSNTFVFGDGNYYSLYRPGNENPVGVPVFIQPTEPDHPGPYIWYQTDGNGNVLDIKVCT